MPVSEVNSDYWISVGPHDVFPILAVNRLRAKLNFIEACAMRN